MLGPEMNGPERLMGVAAGAVTALVFLVPQSWGDFARRGSVSLISGMVFTTPLREYMNWPMTYEYVLASGFSAAFVSWFVMTAIVKGLQKMEITGKKK